MGTAHEAVEYARTFVGKIHETPPGSNHTPIGVKFGWDGVAYCAEGMWVVEDHVEVPIFKTASAHLLINSGTDPDFGSLVTKFANLEVGDIVGWNFDPAANTIPNIHHVSMVSKPPTAESVTHIGFNTSPPASGGSESNGEGCWEKVYPRSFFCCAWRPHYDGGSNGDNGTPRARFTLEVGDKGADVRLWQRMLNVVDKAGLSVDGRFDADTVTATRRWQRAHDRDPDGSVSLKTLRTLEKQIAKL